MNTLLLPDFWTACPKSHFSGTDTDNNFAVNSVSVMNTVLVITEILLKSENKDNNRNFSSNIYINASKYMTDLANKSTMITEK